MSEVALYRKYRPKTFANVIGQDHIVKTLEGEIKKKSISHAYLFAGSRGTGKTSVARIFASEIGCNPVDLYELDAASNRGIDEIRSIREAVHTLPFESPYKVYILDEAHMLTDAAWNALLKTLEEPPPHVIFILATTEIDKVPETIYSRCEVHTFKKPNQKILKKFVETMAKNEGFSLEQSSADLVATLSEGSFRDAASVLQKIIGSSKDKKISVEEVETITGSPKSELLNSIVKSLEEGNSDKGLKALSSALEGNIDLSIFLKLLLERLRAILLLRFAKDLEEEIKEQFTEEDFELLKKTAMDKKSKINSTTLLEFLKAADLVGRASSSSLPVELAIIKVTEEK